MTSDEELVTPGASRQPSSNEGPDSDAMSGENIAEGLSVLKRDSFQPTPIATPQPDTSKPMFVLPQWHKAYADALISADSHQEVRILEAEIAILARFLTEFACPIERDECRDLQRAIQVLLN
jgi:hypothetical protein